MELCEVGEVKQSPCDSENTIRNCISEEADKDFLHFFVLGPGPLFDARDPLVEVAKPCIAGHHFEAAVDLLASDYL